MDHFRYLGVYLADNLEDTIKTTLNKTLEKIKIKNSLLRQKKHNLINQEDKSDEAWHNNKAKPCTAINSTITKAAGEMEKEINKAFEEENQIVNKRQ